MAHKLRKITGTYKPDEKIVKENQRRVTVESIDINYNVFKKTPGERARLKAAKSGIVTPRPVIKKKSRGGWAWRMRRRLRKEGLEYAEIEKRISQFATTRIALKKSSAQNSPSE
jgi:hypothetical protein